MSSIAVPRETCVDYAQSSKLEWLETNGTGAFAMGTVSGANTRRYHGLLVASLHPPVERYVLLSKVDEEVTIDGQAGMPVPLGANQYPGTVHPAGFQFLVGFRLDPGPIWTYEIGGTRIEKRVFLVEGHQTVVIEYRANAPCRLRVRPFLAFRDYHSLARANDWLDGRIREGERSVEIRPYSGLPALTFHHSGGRFEAGGGWYFNTEYLEELERGLDFREDLYCPGALVLELGAEAAGWILAGIDGQARMPVPRERLGAADQFRVRRADGTPTIIAGYPWFTDWGRDTMICLPGLLIARGLLDEAEHIIRGFLRYLDRGLIPNRFPDHDEPPEYNTADATLWMFQAVYACQQAGRDVSFFYPAAKEIIEWHQRGTHHNIAVDPDDGLLSAGQEGSQLTWMDARVGDWVVTPRHGKPVEINALWYNALRMMEGWAKQLDEAPAARAYARAAKRAKDSFSAKFWNAERQCLYDVIAPSGPDPKLRPNQIFAVSLPFPLLTKPRQRAVVKAVESNLLTPFGLRTLAPGEEGYRPRYHGNQLERDGAYHQGTVWPWLLGPFVTAYWNAFGRSKKNLAWGRSLIRSLEGELHRGCLGTIGEIYDADPPHRPAGAPAQAWSVAELLRVRNAA